MMAIMCVLHTWLAELLASQLCLAASVLLRKTPAAQTVDHIDFACEYQLSGKSLPNIVIPVPAVSSSSVSMVWTINWAVQAMLTKLAEMDCHHPAAKLVNCFTARIGHAGPILDEINDQQLLSQLKAKPLLVLGPFELPAQLAAAVDADEKANLAHAVGSLDIEQAPDTRLLRLQCVMCRHGAAELMINMCIKRYSQYKTQLVLGRLCIAVAEKLVRMPVLGMQQLVWLTKQSMMPGRLVTGKSGCSIKAFIVKALRGRALSVGSDAPCRMFCEQAWSHGFVQAALDGVAENLPGSEHWIDEFNDWAALQCTYDHGHHLETRFGLVVAVFRVAEHKYLCGLAKMLNLMRSRPALSQPASYQLCQMAVDAGMLGAVHRAYAVPGAATPGLVSLCLWLATHQYDKYVVSNMDTILQQDCPWGAERDLCNLVLMLAPHMDNDRKAKVVLLLSNHDVTGNFSYSAWMVRTPLMLDVMVVCVEQNDLAREVLLDTWLPRAVIYFGYRCGGPVPPQAATSFHWIDYVQCVHDVLVKIQLGSQAGDKAALPSLEKFFRLGKHVPVTSATDRYLTNMGKIYKRLGNMPDQPDQPDQPPTKRTCIATLGST